MIWTNTGQVLGGIKLERDREHTLVMQTECDRLGPSREEAKEERADRGRGGRGRGGRGRTWWSTWLRLSHCRLLRKRTPCPVSSWTEQTLLLSNPLPGRRCPLFFILPPSLLLPLTWLLTWLFPFLWLSSTHSLYPRGATNLCCLSCHSVSLLLFLSDCLSLSHYFHQSSSLSPSLSDSPVQQGCSSTLRAERKRQRRGHKYSLEHSHKHLHRLTFHMLFLHRLAFKK